MYIYIVEKYINEAFKFLNIFFYTIFSQFQLGLVAELHNWAVCKGWACIDIVITKSFFFFLFCKHKSIFIL